jgi:hypothetical protein
MSRGRLAICSLFCFWSKQRLFGGSDCGVGFLFHFAGRRRHRVLRLQGEAKTRLWLCWHTGWFRGCLRLLVVFGTFVFNTQVFRRTKRIVVGVDCCCMRFGCCGGCGRRAGYLCSWASTSRAGRWGPREVGELGGRSAAASAALHAEGRSSGSRQSPIRAVVVITTEASTLRTVLEALLWIWLILVVGWRLVLAVWRLSHG